MPRQFDPLAARLAAALFVLALAMIGIVAPDAGAATFGHGPEPSGAEVGVAVAFWIGLLVVAWAMAGSLEGLLAVGLVSVFGTLAGLAGVGASRLDIYSVGFLATAVAGLSCLATAAFGVRWIARLLRAPH